MLTAEQKTQYREQGYVLVSGLFTEGELDRLESEFDGIIERRLGHDAQLDATWEGDWKNQYGRTTITHTHDVQAYSAEWTKLLVHDRLTEALADCLGTPNVQLHHTKLFQKPRESGSGFPMHQDAPFFPHARHSLMAAIIHLTSADDVNGCVRVIAGSHRPARILPTLPDTKHLDPDRYPVDQAVACPAERGDVLLFSYLTIHGSGPNRSDRLRKTVLVQVRDPEDEPTVDTHRSHAQGLMLRGVNPLTTGRAAAEATLDAQNAVAR